MKYACVRDLMGGVFLVCIVTRAVTCARVWKVCVFRHADVCLYLMCILWQLLILHSALLAVC